MTTQIVYKDVYTHQCYIPETRWCSAEMFFNRTPNSASTPPLCLTCGESMLNVLSMKKERIVLFRRTFTRILLLLPVRFIIIVIDSGRKIRFVVFTMKTFVVSIACMHVGGTFSRFVLFHVGGRDPREIMPFLPS